MIVRRFVVAALLAACFAVPGSAQFGVTLGGGHGKDDTGGRKSKDCSGVFCVHLDGNVLDKVLPAATPQTTDTKICIHKFNDVNGNAHQDFGEPGIANWDFTVVGPNGPVQMTTGPGGACFTSQFPAGAYTATETAQSGWLPTTPGGQSQTFTLVPGQDVTLTFGNHYNPTQIPGILCVIKYNDLNGNGARDAGEPVMPGWLFTVKNASGAVADFGTTDAQGQFCTTHPLSGTATAVETPQSGWTSTDPGGTLPSKTVTIVAGQTVSVAFGNQVPPQPKGQICVAKYNDVNSDGAHNAGEPMLSGWQFTISGPSGPLTLTTGSNGTACTPISLALGTYTATEVAQSGWTNTSPAGTSPHRTVTVVAGTSTGNLMFGNAHTVPGQICITKYWDQNRNGNFDAGEPLLSGWGFVVTNASGAGVGMGSTDAQGRYCTAPGLPVGSYNVKETPQPWWVNTDPHGPPINALPAQKTVTVAATHITEVQFGNIKSGRLCVHKYDDLNANGQRDPGEPPLAGWSFHTRYVSWMSTFGPVLTTDSNGTACIDLPPGPDQEVDEVSQPGWIGTDPTPVYIPASPPWVYKTYTIVEGQTTDVYVGNHHINPAAGMVCVVKYNDVNHNGAFDAGEWKLPGWHFTVKNGQSMTVGTLVTDAKIKVCMELANGTYTAFETMQMGWKNSDPPGSTPLKTFTIAAGQVVDLVFGNYQIMLP